MSLAYVEKFWQRTLYPQQAEQADPSWNKEMEALNSFGAGMEETLRYLYHERPDLDTFKHWLNSRNSSTADASIHEDVLSADDLTFWNENGYVVLKNAISQEDSEAARTAVWEFLGMDPNNSTTWYKPHSELRGLMLNLVDHPALNKNRQSARIKKAYEQLYNSTAIYKRVDKVSFNPPETGHFRFAGDGLHWDVSLKQPIPTGLQGLLYLTDCSAEDGAFNCVPGFHNSIDSWIEQLPTGVHPRAQAPQVLQPVAVPGKAGDFVIWHQALPHCATPNRSTTPRIVQYLTYWPTEYTEQKEWI